jgi:hypothetical protein
MPDDSKPHGVLWLPQEVIDQIKAAPPITHDEQGRPTTLWGRPIIYVDLPPIEEVLVFEKKKLEELK